MPKYSKLPQILYLVACLASLMVSAVVHGDDTRGNAVRGEEIIRTELRSVKESDFDSCTTYSHCRRTGYLSG